MENSFLKIPTMNNDKKPWTLETIKEFVSHISSNLFGQKLYITSEEDKLFNDPNIGKRVYIRVYYDAACSKTGHIERWKGRKWYLSPYMTEMEVAMTVKDALLKAVEHEILEGFKFDNTIIINPHISFRKLLEVSPHEEVRKEIPFDF